MLLVSRAKTFCGRSRCRSPRNSRTRRIGLRSWGVPGEIDWSGICGSGMKMGVPPRSLLAGPRRVPLDRAIGKLWVADEDCRRVLDDAPIGSLDLERRRPAV